MTTTLKPGDRVEVLPGADLGPFLLPGAAGIVHHLYPAREEAAPGMPSLHDTRNDFVAGVVFYGLQRHRPKDYGIAPAHVTNGIITWGGKAPVSECVPVRVSEVKVTGNIMLEGSNA